MNLKKSILLGLCVSVLNVVCRAQNGGLKVQKNLGFVNNKYALKHNLKLNAISLPMTSTFSDYDKIHTKSSSILRHYSLTKPTGFSTFSFNQTTFSTGLNEGKTGRSFKDRRNLYSSMWAFASLNYIYADLIGLMDKNTLAQYQSGVVNGIDITPNFLGTAAVFMQVPLANVFLPQIIKNERTLRWVQIASGTLMTLVQSGTLFVGKPSPSYAVFSAFEIAATAFITIDALKWKPKSTKKPLSFK